MPKKKWDSLLLVALVLAISVLPFSLALSGWQNQEPSIFIKAAISIVFLFILYVLLIYDRKSYSSAKLIGASIVFTLLILFNPILPIHINHYVLMAIGLSFGGSLLLFAIVGAIEAMNAPEEKEYSRAGGVICGTPFIRPMTVEEIIRGSRETENDEDEISLKHDTPLSKALAEEKIDDLVIPFGRDPSGETFFADFFKLRSLLVVGATSSGKSNFLHLILRALSSKFPPEQLKFILVDPKRSEFGIYRNSPRLMRNVAFDRKETLAAFQSIPVEIENRFELFEREGVRNINEYNKGRSDCLPYIFLVVDELSDAMLQGDGAEIRKAIINATIFGPGAGIFLVLSTSSIKKSVIPGDMLANIISVVSFRVICKKDSEYILGESGAEKLLWQGEALIKSPETNYNLTPFMTFLVSYEEKLLVRSPRSNG